MCNDSDQELSDLDIESKTWNKLEKNMKLLGFREGAAKGRDLSLQEGFNLGYLNGVKLGEYLGIVKGVISCQKELGLSPQEGLVLDQESNILSNEICVICSEDKHHKTLESEETNLKTFELVISAQLSHNKELINNLEKSDFNAYFEKR